MLFIYLAAGKPCSVNAIISSDCVIKVVLQKALSRFTKGQALLRRKKVKCLDLDRVYKTLKTTPEKSKQNQDNKTVYFVDRKNAFVSL